MRCIFVHASRGGKVSKNAITKYAYTLLTFQTGATAIIAFYKHQPKVEGPPSPEVWRQFYNATVL